MVSTITSQQILRKLQEDKSNLFCADCLSSDVNSASVSYGSLICELCAIAHRALGQNISYVKLLTDTWSIRQLKIMTVGGNSTLKQFFDTYNMPSSASVEYKYCTIAARYYREMLKVMAEGETCNMQAPSIEEGLNLITDPREYGEVEFVVEEDEEEEEEKNEGGMMSGIFGSAINNTLNAGKNIYGKVKEIDTYKKIEGGATAAVSKLGEGIKWSAKKGKDQLGKGVEWGAQKGLEQIEKGALIGSKGVNLLKSEALNALGQMTVTAANTYNKLQLGEKAKNIKEETMNMLTLIEKNTLGRVKPSNNDEVIDENHEIVDDHDNSEPISPPG